MEMRLFVEIVNPNYFLRVRGMGTKYEGEKDSRCTGN